MASFMVGRGITALSVRAVTIHSYTFARSLSDLKNRSENLAGRGQILLVSQVNSCSIDQESGEVGQAGKPHSGGSQICAVQANLQ